MNMKVQLYEKRRQNIFMQKYNVPYRLQRVDLPGNLLKSWKKRRKPFNTACTRKVCYKLENTTAAKPSIRIFRSAKCILFFHSLWSYPLKLVTIIAILMSWKKKILKRLKMIYDKQITKEVNRSLKMIYIYILKNGAS